MRTLHSAHGYHARMGRFRADPDLLETFLAVRRRGSVTRAAEELFLSQPAVSRRIARLEASLGLVLFERLGKTLHPTDAGETLAEHAAAFLGSADRLTEAVRARQAGETGRLRIGASTTPGLYLLPAVLRRFRARHPEIDVRYSVENSLHIEEKIVRNDLDMGFVGAHLSHGSVRLERLVTDEIVWYAATTHPFVERRRTIAPKDLAEEPCLVRETGSATRRLVDAALRRARVRLQRTLLIGCPEAAKVLVRAGVGIAYMSSLGLEGPGAAGLARISVAKMDLSRPIHLALHADKRLSPSMRLFLEAVSESLGTSRRR